MSQTGPKKCFTMIQYPKIVKNTPILIQQSIVMCTFKGALDNILQFSFWLNLIYHVESDC